jgi:putative endonuclease
MSNGAGAAAESAAQQYLERRGLSLITGNFRTRAGEIDLVMRHNSTLVFVEVRQRTNARYGGAAASVTPVKQQRIRRTALMFLQQNPCYRDMPCRFDVIAYSSAIADTDPDWFVNAF